MNTKTDTIPIIFGNDRLTINDIIDIAFKNTEIRLNNEPEIIDKIKAPIQFLEDLLEKEGEIYGVTTGYGESCTRPVPLHLVNELSTQLSRFHGCGLGNYFSHQQARAITAVRLCSLAQGHSGVRMSLMQQLVEMLNHDVMPLIPEEGSVGASGDLTPLSYLAAAIMGERTVTYQGEQRPALEVLESLDITPITLNPKEGLAIMNGTAVMTAVACEAFHRTAYLCKLASRLTAMTSIALQGNASHYDEDLFAVKPHAGQIQVAAWIRSDLKQAAKKSARIQDRYSLRCAPHVIGVVQDSLPWFKKMIENELNSANDNPIINAEKKLVLHGGHFYGGHIATVMDTMKTQVANLADLLDRQMALLLDPKFNKGLPDNLSFASAERASINHGFKAVHIAVSAWTAEALKNTMPASVFSRSTECHNQDKVSMGTIAARDCLRVLELTEQVFAAHMLVTTQALSIRLEKQELEQTNLTAAVTKIMADILKDFDIVTEDRPLDSTLREFVTQIRQQKWNLYNDED